MPLVKLARSGVMHMWFESYKEDLKEQIGRIIRDEFFGKDEFELVDIAFYGSRVSGKASVDSDLDVLVEYKGTAREDTIFDVLAEQQLMLEDVRLDINPIKNEKSGTIVDYLERCDDNWKEHVNHRRRSR